MVNISNQMFARGNRTQSSIRAAEEITVKKFTSGEFAEVACIVLRFALVMCQPGLASARECRVSLRAEFANLRFIFLNAKRAGMAFSKQ